MSGDPMPCPGCADGTLLAPWPGPSGAPYREAPTGAISVEACRVCAGVWVDRTTLGTLLDAAAKSAAATPQREVPRKTMPAGAATAKVVYRHCPVCKQAMLRKNFGSISGIVVDVCGHHGTFFDYGELPEVVDFVRRGGLQHAQRHAAEEHLRDAQSRLRSETMTVPNMGPYWMGGELHDPLSDELLRRVGTFLRNMFR